jgi:hypothetical protein
LDIGGPYLTVPSVGEILSAMAHTDSWYVGGNRPIDGLWRAESPTIGTLAGVFVGILSTIVDNLNYRRVRPDDAGAIGATTVDTIVSQHSNDDVADDATAVAGQTKTKTKTPRAHNARGASAARS